MHGESGSISYYPNRFGRQLLLSLENDLGIEGMENVLTQANLADLIHNFPADDFEPGFDFSLLSTINQTLQTVYGFHGARSFGLRAGQLLFQNMLQSYGALAGVDDPQFQALAENKKMLVGLDALARILNVLSGQQIMIHEQKGGYLYSVGNCADCFNRLSLKPDCNFTAGILRESAFYFTRNHQYRVKEIACRADGAAACDFLISKSPD